MKSIDQNSLLSKLHQIQMLKEHSQKPPCLQSDLINCDNEQNTGNITMKLDDKRSQNIGHVQGSK